MSPGATLADVGVVIVNYRTAGDVDRCLAALRPAVERGLRVVVVDNASDDDSADRIDAGMGGRDGIVLVRSRENLGFGAGNNLGVAWFDEHDPPRFLWFLNPDCEVEPGAAEALRAAADRDPAAVWGALLVERDAPDVVQCAGGFRYWPCLTRMRPVRPGESMDYVAGASMFLSRTVFDAAGRFSPDFFLYYEENDLCTRVRANGGHLAFEADAVIRHAGGAATGGKSSVRRKSSAVSEYHATLSALIFTWRHRRWCFPIAAAVRLPFKAVQLTGAGQPQLILSVVAAYWAFARRVLVRR